MNKRMKKIASCLISSVITVTLINTPYVYAESKRYDGIDRIQTALNIAQSNWKNDCKYVVIAGADNDSLMDALLAAPYAKAYNAPVILNFKGNIVDSDVLAALKKWNTKTVFLASGEKVLSKNFQKSLENNGYEVLRIGDDNIEKASMNAANTLKNKTKTIDEVCIVSDDKAHIVDSLSAAPIAALKGMPILITSKDKLSDLIKSYINTNKISKIYVIGGTGVISDKVKNEIKGIRLDGKDRFDTNIKLLTYFKDDLKNNTVYISSGMDEHIVDALAGAGLAAKDASSLVLVGNRIADVTKNYMKDNLEEDSDTAIFGGEGAVSLDTEDQVQLIKNDEDDGILKLSMAECLNSDSIAVKVKHPMSSITKDNFAVKTSDGSTSLKIKSLEKAPWDKSSMTYIIHSAENLELGKQYIVNDTKITAKNKDNARPEITYIEAWQFDKVLITFSEPVNKDKINVSFEDSLKEKNLNVQGTEYFQDNPYKILVTTAPQDNNTLYKCDIYGACDMTGDYMAEEEEKTFTGIGKDNVTQLEIENAEAVSSKNVLVKFNTNVDEESGENISNYLIREIDDYGNDINIVSAKLNDRSSVLLSLAEPMKDSTLYNIGVDNIETYSGVAARSDKKNTDFIGRGPFVTPMDFTEEGNEAAAVSSKKIIVKFKRHMDKQSLKVSNFNITDAYTGSTVYIYSLKIINDGTVELEVSPMNDTFYKLSLGDLKDLDGNSFVKSKNSKIFKGTTKTAEITSIENIELKDDNVSLVVKFNNFLGDNAEDVNNYTIDNGIGHPSKAEVSEESLDTVKLTIPRTINSRLYKLTASGLVNADGDLMKNDITSDFIGSGKDITSPEIKEAAALDKNTIKITFDRPVTDISIDGSYRVWDSSKGTINQNTVTITGKYKRILTQYQGLYAYQDPEDENSLIVRNGYSTFEDSNSDSSGEFTLSIKNVKGNCTFDYNNNSMENIKIDKIEALNDKSIRVYFNQPVEIEKDAVTAKLVKSYSDADKIQKSGQFYSVSSAFNIDNATPIDDTYKIYDFKVSSGYLSYNDYYFVVNPSITSSQYSGVHDYTKSNDAGFVTFDDDSSLSGVQYYKKFKGSNNSAGVISNITVNMRDCKTLEVQFPEVMNTESNQSSKSVLNKNNYKIADSSGSEIQNSFMLLHAVDIQYNKNKAVISLNEKIPESSSGYYLMISDDIMNALETKHVKSSTWSSNSLMVQFAGSTEAAQKLYIKDKADFSQSSNELSIKLSQKCFSTISLDKNILLADLNIVVIDQNGSEYMLQPSDVNNIITDINDSYSSSSDTIKIIFRTNLKLKSGAIGKVKLIPDSTLKGINGENSKESTAMFVQ